MTLFMTEGLLTGRSVPSCTCVSRHMQVAVGRAYDERLVAEVAGREYRAGAVAVAWDEDALNPTLRHPVPCCFNACLHAHASRCMRHAWAAHVLTPGPGPTPNHALARCKQGPPAPPRHHLTPSSAHTRRSSAVPTANGQVTASQGTSARLLRSSTRVLPGNEVNPILPRMTR